MPFQMRFRMLSTLLLSLIVPAGSASADMRFNFENCYSTEKFWNPLALVLHEGRIRKVSLKNKKANRKRGMMIE